ncbi:MAG: hypothetical protein AAF827_01030 [Cyanobacteria bacterium P01_D01_bin.6]
MSTENNRIPATRSYESFKALAENAPQDCKKHQIRSRINRKNRRFLQDLIQDEDASPLYTNFIEGVLESGGEIHIKDKNGWVMEMEITSPPKKMTKKE